jgi:Heparinase II/III-like protein/Heparinase II/III N-terminus
VSLAWREKLSRATSLSWDEGYTRVRQELGKRLDVGLYRFGLQPQGINIGTSEAHGNFFFSPTDLSERLRLLRDHLPTEVNNILSEADQICRHRFRLLGYIDLDFGTEIDWHLDAVHNKRSPRKPWHKIDFLNFAEVGDHKVIWELSRHQHFVTLAKAWLLTHDDRYAKELISQWYAWQRANLYPMGINWVSSLEVAFRSLAWIWVSQLIVGCPEFNREFNTNLLRGLALNGRYIERYLSTYFSPNTHLLGEAVALFFIGVLCPQIPAASRWRKKGWEILLQEAGRQVHPDGVYFEQSLYYHVYALDLFLHARLLASRNGINVPASFDEVIQRMLVVVQVLSQSGPPHGFGDDDGGRVFDPRRNRAEHMPDPLGIGAIFFQNEQLRVVAPLTEEAIWLFGEQATSFLGHSSAVVPMRSQCFPHGGIYVSAEPGNCQQIVIDAGPVGAMRGGHGHADALSLKYSAHGRPFLIDSGTFCYMSSGNERNAFRGSGAHNTLRVDKLDQAMPDGPFAWKDLPLVRAESWITGETFTLFSGSHTGYLRLRDPVLHRRFVVHLYKSFWMVRDIADGNAPHILETFWHLTPSLSIAKTGNGFIASQQDEDASRHSIAFAPVDDSEWDCRITSGYVSPIYGVAEPAKALRCSAEIRLPAEHAMVVQALTADCEAPGELVRVKAQADQGDTTVYEYRENGRTHFLIFRNSKEKTWTFGDWASDGDFLCYCAEAQRISRLVACHATFIKYRGEPLVSGSRRVERFEYWDGDGKRQVSSSDPELLVGFSDAALASWDAGVVG